MLIKELRICNFLVFAGEQSIELPTAAESNLVVILAPNNTGKTNVIRALKFLFYGHFPDCTEITAYRLIHDGVRTVARIGQDISGWVEMTLDTGDDDDDRQLTLRRTVRTCKRGNDQWMPPEVTLHKVLRGAKVRLIPDSEDVLQTKLRAMVPEQLFDAFYFRGEPLDGKLLGGVTGIRKSLTSFLHEDRWQEAEQAAEAVRQAYTRELSRLTEKHREYNKLLQDEELFRGFIVKEQAKLAAKQDQLNGVTAEFEEITAKLQELGSGGDGERLVGQLRDTRSKLDAARRTRERADAEIARLVGASRGVPFLAEAFPTARRILVQMREDNIIPADLSERFVNRILASEQCVCGRPHDDESRLNWTRYKEKTLSADLSRGLSDLLSALDDEHPESFTKLAGQVTRKLSEMLEARTSALRQTEELNAQVTDIEARLQASPVDAFRSLTQKLKDLSAARERLRGEIATNQSAINTTQKNLDALNGRMEKAKPSGAIARTERALQKDRERAEKLRLLIQQSRQILEHSFHELLQSSVSEYYDQAAYDGSKARINRATLLPAIEANGQVHGNLGGGQSQLLALAYIVSLSRLRKSLHIQMQRLGIGLGRVDDQSFFLDSPFNHVTEHYAQAIASFLEGNARQVVLLLARQQWNLVRSILEPAAARILAFEYHTLKDKIGELKEKDSQLEDFTYPVGTSQIRLVQELPHVGQSPYTTITSVA